MQPMIIHDLDDFVLDRDDDVGVEEIGRAILSEGSWATVVYLVRTRPGPDEPWGEPCLWFHRYQKVKEGWKLAGRVQMKEKAQARLMTALREWRLI